MSPERFLLIASASLALFTALSAFVLKTWRELRKVSRTMDDFGGTPERPGHPATKGVFERMLEQDNVLAAVVKVVEKVSARQEEIAAVATKAAADVSVVLGELTTNSGASTKDQAVEAARLAALASVSSEETKAIAFRVEDLLRRHMQNGVEIMEVGLANDQVTAEALEELGVTVVYRPLPAVDAGLEL